MSYISLKNKSELFLKNKINSLNYKHIPVYPGISSTEFKKIKFSIQCLGLYSLFPSNGLFLIYMCKMLCFRLFSSCFLCSIPWTYLKWMSRDHIFHGGKGEAEALNVQNNDTELQSYICDFCGRCEIFFLSLKLYEILCVLSFLLFSL